MEIIFITEKLNSKKCVGTIDEQINTYATRIARNKYTFQHDNAAVHIAKAKAVKRYFANKRIRVLEWLAKSLDFNLYRKLLGEFGEDCIPEWKTICKYIVKEGARGLEKLYIFVSKNGFRY